MTSNFQYISQKEISLRGIRNILAFGDIGCTGFDSESKSVLIKLLNYKPDIFFVLGDLTNAGTEKEFDEVMKFCGERTSSPIFTLCGNHDVSGYSKWLGLSTYAIVLEQILCIFLDNSQGHFSVDDLGFMHDELKKHDDKEAIIFFHIPPPLSFSSLGISPIEWYKLRKALDNHKDRIKYIVCGHLHGFYEYVIDGYRTIITAGGGAKMIHELPKERFKIYNGLKISLESGAIATNILPVML